MLLAPARRTSAAMKQDTQERRAVALFSGGLDSILAAKLVEEQGVRVTCLHFVTPFFGSFSRVEHWERVYSLEIRPVDIGEDFVRLLRERPAYGFGSVLNPCVDCKILMLRRARRIMGELGAMCIISGEVLGQRPMSQRRDTLNVIRRDAGVKDVLLRPLSALHLDPTDAELSGRIDRTKLLGISGRGRKEQMALARHYKLKEIPTPAGGCRLAEQENARSYWPILCHVPSPAASDFSLVNAGRQLWNFDAGAFWLTIGRKQADNDAIMELAGPDDLLFKVKDFPGPVALGRFMGGEWPAEIVRSAAACVASYSPKAVREYEESSEAIAVRVHPGSLDAPGREVSVVPSRQSPTVWKEYSWQEAQAAIKKESREAQA